ncbi:S-adenosylhomocysteine hydrolase [Hahella chejuensis KCTC 2396]|uniref:S-adenosylhomocysteine hydrolase n=2 Tax=Hahella chejuensis TaxID=158327 RepID=Q2S8K2_HAHCH|nr:S-adenosylhomocysteine hydrolase [Hahella chejuensis KCTC 2396]
MSYHFQGSQLRIFKKYARQDRNKAYLKNTRFIIIEHLLPTTEEMVRCLMESEAEIFALLAKPYSIDSEVLMRLQGDGIKVIQKSYQYLEESDYLKYLILEAIDKSKADKKNVVLIDVGGYFSRPLKEISDKDKKYISGVVEDTTFGHNRYQMSVKHISVPVFSVARSGLKEIEARFVGRDAVSAIEYILRKKGISLAGRNALVIGYGMIGENVARALRGGDLNVSVYDKHDHKNLSAFIDGYAIHKKRELIKNADIIFSATGDPSGSMTYEEIEECKNNVILASVGSKDTEFDIKEVKAHCIEEKDVGEELKGYVLPNSKRVLVAKQGAAVNFILPSMPVEILDLVFSEILICIMLILTSKTKGKYPPGIIHELHLNYLNEISKDWLRLVNL